MTWHRSNAALRKGDRIRYDGNTYRVVKIHPGNAGADTVGTKGPNKGKKMLPIAVRSEVERRGK